MSNVRTQKARLAQKTGWLYRSWRKCGDVNDVPRYLRCQRCLRLVTHGQIETGGCLCGNRRICPALALTWGEAVLLKLGWFPLSPVERASIKPVFAGMGVGIRTRLLGDIGR
jgi:hypothetical protein